MIKRIIIALVFLSAAAAALGYGQVQNYGMEGGNFGVGFIFGQPTGIAWNYRMDYDNAIDGIVGFGPYERFRLQADYLWVSHPFDEKRFSLHYGPGLGVGVVKSNSSPFSSSSGETGFAVRGVVGLGYNIKNTPLDVFMQVAPLVVFAPSGGTGIDVGFGMRAYP